MSSGAWFWSMVLQPFSPGPVQYVALCGPTGGLECRYKYNVLKYNKEIGYYGRYL